MEVVVVDVGRWLVVHRVEIDRAEAGWLERPPPDEMDRVRDVKILRGDDGTGHIIVTLGDLEVEEFAATLQAFIRPSVQAWGSVFLHEKTAKRLRSRSGPDRRKEPTRSSTWPAPLWLTPTAGTRPATPATSCTS
jgi:hypothetical protein